VTIAVFPAIRVMASFLRTCRREARPGHQLRKKLLQCVRMGHHIGSRPIVNAGLRAVLRGASGGRALVEPAGPH